MKQVAYDLLAQQSKNGKQKSRNTVRAMLAPLKAMFNHAIEDGHFTGVKCCGFSRRAAWISGTRARK